MFYFKYRPQWWMDVTPHIELDYDEDEEQRRREASRLIAMSGGSDTGGLVVDGKTWKVTDEGFFYEPNNPLVKFTPGEMVEKGLLSGSKSNEAPVEAPAAAPAPAPVPAPAPGPGKFLFDFAVAGPRLFLPMCNQYSKTVS